MVQSTFLIALNKASTLDRGLGLHRKLQGKDVKKFERCDIRETFYPHL